MPFWRRALKKEMANYPSILAWEIPWTEKRGGLQSMGSWVERSLATNNNKEIESQKSETSWHSKQATTKPGDD